MTATDLERPRRTKARRLAVRRVVRCWRWVVGATLAVALGVTVLVVVHHRAATCRSPVVDRALSDLDSFTSWLDDNHVRGYVGEVGWPSGPDAEEWNKVASAWFDRADAAHLWVTVWAAGRWWPASYRMAVYRLSGRPGVPPSSGPQAAVAAAHYAVPGALRGVALPSGSFGAGPDGPSSYSNSRPGRPDREYYYENGDDYRSLADRGVQVVRLSFTWERVQRSLDGPLDAAEIARLRTSVAAAHRAGLAVILDLHNYGDYYRTAGHRSHQRLVLGSPALPAASFADLWGRLARAFRDEPGVLGYGLMNEPSHLARSTHEGVRIWEDASQGAVEAIRLQHDSHLVLVSGYGGASPVTWAVLQPRAWIEDPDHAVRYEAHQYFDAARSGGYALSYADETAAAAASGFGGCPAPTSSRAPARALGTSGVPASTVRILR